MIYVLYNSKCSMNSMLLIVLKLVYEAQFKTSLIVVVVVVDFVIVGSI